MESPRRPQLLVYPNTTLAAPSDSCAQYGEGSLLPRPWVLLLRPNNGGFFYVRGSGKRFENACPLSPLCRSLSLWNGASSAFPNLHLWATFNTARMSEKNITRVSGLEFDGGSVAFEHSHSRFLGCL